MTVKQLRELLADVPDEARILVPSTDHGYREPSVSIGTALHSEWGDWTQDYGDQDTPEETFGKRLAVVVVD